MLTENRLIEVLDYNPKTGIFRWRDTGELAGTKGKSAYVRISIDDCGHLAHRLAWLYVFGVWPSADLDHKDTNKANNKLNNLRLASNKKNQRNTNISVRNKSGYKGVSYNKLHKKFRANIQIDGKLIYLGAFNDPKEASEVYNARAKQEFGEFYRDTRAQ